MKHGRTMMSSFLFNVALILLATTASIQFSAQCFALYANGTSIYRTFGLQVRAACSLAPACAAGAAGGAVGSAPEYRPGR